MQTHIGWSGLEVVRLVVLGRCEVRQLFILQVHFECDRVSHGVTV
jgi:hypothetical protein